MNNHQNIPILNQRIKTTDCHHHRVTRKYTEENIGTTEKQYCLDCGEFVESKFFSGKKIVDFDTKQSIWRHHL
jgi:hypothetical protein